VTSQVLKDFTRFERTDASERIRALALKRVKIAPLLKVRKGGRNGFGDCRDSRRIANKPKVKHDVFVALVSLQAEQLDQKGQPRLVVWQRIQCCTQFGNVFWFFHKRTWMPRRGRPPQP